MTYPDSTRPTDEDVWRLANRAQQVMEIIDRNRDIHPNSAAEHHLAEALEPFGAIRPDPEAELIEAMAKAHAHEWDDEDAARTYKARCLEGDGRDVHAFIPRWDAGKLSWERIQWHQPNDVRTHEQARRWWVNAYTDMETAA